MDFYTNVQLVGNSILYCGYSNGNRIIQKDKLYPTLFISSENKTKYKTLDDTYVKPIKFETVQEARKFISSYENVQNFEVYGYDRFLYQYISDRFPDDEIVYDKNYINTIIIDIETTSENGFPNVEETIEEILCITIKDLNKKNIITWGQKEYKNTSKDVNYIECTNEQKLLSSFIDWWVQNTPDIVTGWNIKLFDIPYIYRRIKKVLGNKFANSLSPWNKVDYNEIIIYGNKNIHYNIFGVSILDYIDLYRKYTYTNQESYSLDHIGSVELNISKLNHSEFDTFRDFYTQNWQKFVEYNIHDVEIVFLLEEKMKLIELIMTLAYDAKVNYEDVYSQVKTWDNIIFNFLKKNNIVVPPNKKHQKDSQYAGAYVKEPIPGKYDWIVSFDLTSLYPSLIMQFNISPETLCDKKYSGISIDRILNKDINIENIDGKCIAANGCIFDTSKKGIFPRLVEKIFNDRQYFKKEMLKEKSKLEEIENKLKENNADSTEELNNIRQICIKNISKYTNNQMARKIQLNSLYGAIGNVYFRYYKLENAEAITLSGQVAIRWIENKMNLYLNKILKTNNIDYVIASDTDSIFLNLSSLIDCIYNKKNKITQNVISFIDKICKTQFEPYIEECYQELSDYLNSYSQMMKMKRECIADRGIWTAKKRYILNVWDKEGVRYSSPKMKIMGLETARSSTPAYFRDKLENAFKIILNEDNDKLIEFIEDVKKETQNQSINDISFPRGVNNLDKYTDSSIMYNKGTPIHVRGAILYNYYLKKLKITNKYPFILEGEKIKFVYLKTPNPIGENIIAYFQELPKEFNLNSYVDYNMQFEKSFLEPLKSVLNCIDWVVEKRSNLESFFI